MWVWKGGRLNETICNGEADLLETKGEQEADASKGGKAGRKDMADERVWKAQLQKDSIYYILQ